MGHTSILAPSVQELAKQGITKVPKQYLQPNQDPIVVSNTTSLPQIPIINFDKLLCEDATELEKLDHACKEWGFFQLINHGVNPSLVENVKIRVEQFFNLPVEEKKKFWQTPKELQGFGQAYIRSEEEKLIWGDMFYIKTLPMYSRNPHLIPSIPQPFRDNLENYSLELNKLCVTIIEFLSKALKIKPNELLDLFEEGSQSMRMNYYPPCPQPEQVIGLDPHSDATVLTILLEVNDIQGLQIKKDGMWIPINPISDAFVVNVGDTLEILTNGIYRSIEHRATVNSVKERISMATFQNPYMGGYIGPTPSLVTPESPALFKTIAAADYLKAHLSSKIQGKSFLDNFRIHKEIHD
ncbi:putative codeine 3-O-demethylase [Medicago truncatula]|uniref:Flavonol synthase/flavanone 3-hydroxylase n=1 Tax=Medicago truncatula TaxID=3880 RepID=A0A072TFU2_MEDTR|nr:protein SRG1 [Medicago truncatula]KEH16106.1 flavonol synthase/flavanone 3-hydroxylase [Medicago truncatula]RHN55712.1 putative codeine 3-O-demethylase [Medicago truncatula]